MRHRLLAYLVLLLGLIMSELAVLPPPAHAQTPKGSWSEPTLLLSAPPNDNGTTPIVYTGPSNNTHLLYAGRPADDPNGPFALYYARWADGAWTTPVDVLVTPDSKLPPSLAAVEDSKGYLHVFWSTDAVWHTRVALAEAAEPRSWETPEIVYGNKSTLEVTTAIDPDDDIHLVVTTRASTVEHIQLSSDGSTGQAVQIQDVVEDGYYPYRPSLVATAQGRLLACWAELSNSVRDVWCSASEDKGRTWAAPEVIADGHRGVRLVYFPQTKQIGRIIWGGLGVGGRDLQLSKDDGKTWSTPIDLTQGTSMAGYTGQVAVMDSAKDIHALVNPGDGKDVQIRTKNGAWLPLFPTGWQASDWIEMAVADGNTLVVVYWIGGNTYTSHAVLDAPKLAPSLLTLPKSTPTQAEGASVTPTAEVAADSSATPTVTPAAQFSSTGQQDGSSSSQLQGILFGISPAVVVVLGVVLFQLGRRRRR